MPTTEIESRELRVPARDGFPLGATLYWSAQSAPRSPVVLVAGAAGVKRSFYRRYACFLAGNGFDTVTFDYRGIGGSRPEKLRGFDASMRDWAEKDMAGVVDWVVGELHPCRLLLVGHSIGGQLLGLLPRNERITAMLAVAAQSGYWRFWRGRRKLFMWFLWHALMPGATRICSYFPSKRLGLSEDLPAGVALEWARWGRNPEYIVDEQGTPMRKRFLSFTGPIRCYRFDDDVLAPRIAVETLMQCYANAPWEIVDRAAKALGVHSIGHFGFFREQLRCSLWPEALDWLRNQAQIDIGPRRATSEQASSVTGSPPAGEAPR